MMAQGFKPVGWVGAVASAALGCYMLSLNVASERAELLKIERQIVAAKQDIRALQTELGTRGRLAQLEQWNADILALSAPASGQFLDNEVKLARFDQSAPTIDQRADVQLASVVSEPKKAVTPAMPSAAPVIQAAAAMPTQAKPSLVRRASLEASVRPLQASSVSSRLNDDFAREIGAAAKVEAGSGGQ